MKKLILFLLLPLWAMAQTSNGGETEFDYGIKNNSTQTITTPPYLGTFGTDGTQGKIPSAYIEKTDNKQNSLAIDGTGTKYPTVDAVNAALPKTYTTTVYVNTNDPNIATIFDDENPPTVNDDGLKSNTDNLYIGLDASTWVYNGSTYVTKIVPASSNFYINSTSIDAGNSKDVDINRIGAISTSRYIAAGSGLVSRLGSSNIENLGSYLRLANKAGSENNQFQLNASNGVDLWNYSSGVWNKRFTFSSDGYLTATNGTLIGGSGTLTSDYMPKATGIGTLGNSNLVDDGIKVESLVDFKLATNKNVYFGSSNESKINFDGIKFNFYTGGGNRITLDTYNTIISTDNVVLGSNTSSTTSAVGSLLVNTPTGNGVDKLQVNGSTKTTALTLSTPPTTSSGTYDFVTRNTTTGIVEKIASNTIATTASPTFTGTPTAPTAAPGTNDLTIANMAALQAAVTSNIAQTITNGVTTSSPSQDAVFDALAEKASLTGNQVFTGTVQSGGFITGASYHLGSGNTGFVAPSYSASFLIKNPGYWESNVPILATSFVATGGTIRLKNYTVATLPAGTQGDTAFVTDATAPTYLGTLTGGGSVVCPVFYNGTAWVAH